MSNATTRRYAAIQDLTSGRCPTGTNSQGQLATVIIGQRSDIAAEIRELAKLGRTERWTTAIEAWAQAVQDQGNPFLWAFQQYGIYASHVAD